MTNDSTRTGPTRLA